MATSSDSSHTVSSHYDGGNDEIVVVGNDANDVSQQGEDKELAREIEAALQTENEAPTQASRGSPKNLNKRRRESKTKRAALRSNVWNHYEKYDRTLYIEKDGKKKECGFEKRARCKYCSIDLAADSSFNSTSTLRRHVEKVCKKYPGRENLEGTQHVLISDGGVEASLKVNKWWSQEACVKAATEMILTCLCKSLQKNCSCNSFNKCRCWDLKICKTTKTRAVATKKS